VGLTHVHLLPVFDIASVNEAGCTTPVVTPAGATSTAQQATITAASGSDCFNWGYDPRHFSAPEGSYATDAADGRVRVLEFREMVASLHGAGLRVVMDVVYNHTSGNFLDRIVPGYYYRLSGEGVIERSTCCDNTAPEFAMMEKLMIDTLKTWATQYGVDGFRFDIMGHIPKSAMVRAQAEVDAAAGRPLYYYGEAWNFGEVENDRRFEQARQANLAGTGIGSFNDRLRDAMRGGGPFDSGDDILRNQGFASGLCYDLNASNGAGACTSGQRGDLHNRQNMIRIGLAGNLRNSVLNGRAASAYDYGGQQAGYTSDPQEVINYAGVHDGETLYDIAQYKHPGGTSAADRARAQVVALATVLMGQGVPFIHAGDELLRSKAFDRDSYNSGDWFNRIDWTGGTNYLAEFGLPPAEKNEAAWPHITALMSNANVLPAPAQIAATRDAVRDFLALRRDTTMLRLRTGADVMRCVRFPDEAAQQDGLIVMKVGVGDTSCGDGKYRNLLVLINANKLAQTFSSAALANAGYVLHPLQAAGSDAVVRAASHDQAAGAFSVPARTVAVFVQN
jgi:pullulanase